MNKFFALTVFVSGVLFLAAQDEELTDLRFNPSVYYNTKKYQPVQHPFSYVTDKGNIIVFTDTLSLPFVDDFSSNRLRSYKWVEKHIIDTFYNVFGTCLGNEGVETITDYFLTDTAFSYTFDTTTKQFIPHALSPDTFTFFGPAPTTCFSQTPSFFYRWPRYYTYTYIDSTHSIDSVLVTSPADTINYAPVIYFARGETGTLWFDNYAYVNNTYPINPPSIGVATLDGLNEFGLPYNNSNNSTYGTADYLTSQPINLAGLGESDSIYISFFFEAEGLGDYPDADDSLILEFKDNNFEWREIWSHKGYTVADSVPQKFEQVLLPVPSLPIPFSYFHNAFQFRFRNKASLYGNNDHWHIDYVKLDKNRNETDTIVHDIAFVYPFPTILKNFTEMPADQFIYPADLRDSIINLIVHNPDPNANNNPPATNFVKQADEIYPSLVSVAAPVLQTFNAGDYSAIQVTPASEYSSISTGADSLVIVSQVTISPSPLEDFIPGNDTLIHAQNMNSIMAYDDGSAEKAYGIQGIGLKKFAYEFNLNYPDTLAAFQVMFTEVDDNVSNLVFNFYAWDSIKLNDPNFQDTSYVLYSLENRKPTYIDSVNGFATYKLDTPIIISGKIYFGWAQSDVRSLQIGYDLNSTLGKKHMFYYKLGKWFASGITPAGSPMIRLLFDSNYWGGSSNVVDLTERKSGVTVFPNPASQTLYIKSERGDALFNVSLIDMPGQLVMQQNDVNKIDISHLPNGIYLLSLTDIKTGKTTHSKVIKSSY